ncbi:MAG TPA: hypothetical protein VMD09_04220 [Solirubrobacteraceae bacterium]|nr:hypothetical protein [Solirubrobacteraceae bacterium]
MWVSVGVWGWEATSLLPLALDATEVSEGDRCSDVDPSLGDALRVVPELSG